MDDDAITTVQLSESQIVLLSNSLNEVLNGVGIDEPEFSTRLGASRPEAELLKEKLGRILREKFPPK